MNRFKNIFAKKSRKTLAVAIAVVMALSCSFGIALADSSGMSGSGTYGDPYIVTTAAQLAAIPSVGLSSCYKLDNDLDLSSYGQWTPIGASNTAAFTGTFDGNGHTINGLTLGTTASPYTGSYAGLFGWTGSGTTGGVVENLNLTAVSIVVKNANAGGLIGESDGTTITNCSTSGSISSKSIPSGPVGGLIGCQTGSTAIEQITYRW